LPIDVESRNAITIASSRYGNAYSASMTRTSARSSFPPTKPERRPSGTPTVRAKTSEMNHDLQLVCAPQITRESTSVDCRSCP
jgi:hypothetical protein